MSPILKVVYDHYDAYPGIPLTIQSAINLALVSVHYGTSLKQVEDFFNRWRVDGER